MTGPVPIDARHAQAVAARPFDQSVGNAKSIATAGLSGGVKCSVSRRGRAQPPVRLLLGAGAARLAGDEAVLSAGGELAGCADVGRVAAHLRARES